ncbi:CCT2 [Bugula neritina]|uniref:T-complex protein 1 subunit beta n=1 Tax=Bugula neritina TaxID=10212 RepID=A0A7J7KG04_BUGNE|nr:CCT2 [Bugula neritina]
MASLQPVSIMKAGAEEERSEMARMSSFVGAIAVGDLVKSTLGPKGMDKILQSVGPHTDTVTVTNDGATIMKSIGVDNPAAKVLVDISKVQDDEVGDGTTSVVVLACELLKEAEQLVSQKMHPQTIISGWRKSVDVARAALEKFARNHGDDPVKFREDLMNIARTTLSSKILTGHKDYFSNLAVDAVLRLKGSGNLDAIQMIKKPGGFLHNSYLDEGFLLDKKVGVNQPKRVENARILIANTPMDTDKIKVFGSRVRVDGVAKVAELELAEKEKMKEKVELILSHNPSVFINRQLIYNYPEQLFADKGVMAIEHADFEGVERLALVTGVALGEACTIILRGATQQILDEAERSLHDALCVLSETVKETRVVYDMNNGEIADMVELGITESFQVKRQVLMSAAEAAEMILRVDNIVKSAPRQRMPDQCM